MNCDAPGVVDFVDSPIWSIPDIPFDQYLDETSQIYCKDDRVAWVRSNEGIQCLGAPAGDGTIASCSACPWLAVGWIPEPEAPGCGASGPCKAGASCCRDPTAPASSPLCVSEPECPMVYSQCCATAGCPMPFERECGANATRVV